MSLSSNHFCYIFVEKSLIEENERLKKTHPHASKVCHKLKLENNLATFRNQSVSRGTQI